MAGYKIPFNQKKKGKINLKYYLLLFFFNLYGSLFSQNNPWYFEANYYQGSILPHSSQIAHLLTNKPEGFLFSANLKTDGSQYWHRHYNFPDIGFSLHYQNNNNPVLGDLYGAFAHYNFYFLNRNLQFRVAQGIAYATNPYDKEKNFRNLAYGTHWMPSTYFMLSYTKENLWNNLGVNAGVFFIHHSNATIKSPNTSTNTLALTAGLTYSLDENFRRSANASPESYDTDMKYSFIFRTGVNESHILGMGQKPFYHLSFLADKRIGRSGSIQLGTELFLSNTLKELIPFIAESFEETGIKKEADWKRIGLFAGYEMYMNKLSVEGQLGYYIYDQYKQNGNLYQRLGMKYYITEQIFGLMSLKTHYAKAEAFEVGLGIKL
ncbi:acyloxyacyl hydrolase [Paenimyroides ceti]